MSCPFVSRQQIALILLSLMTIIYSTAPALAKDKPAWIDRRPTSNEYIYLVGIRSGAPTVEVGRSEAARQAVSELANYLGVRLQSKLQVFMSEVETKVQDEMKSSSEKVELRGGLIDDWYAEKTSQGTYEVYVLLRYPRVEIEKEQARLAKLLAEKAALAQLGMRQAAEAERQGDAIVALNAYATVIGSATETEDERLQTEALGRMSQVIQGLNLRLVSGNGQLADRSKGTKDPLVVKAVLVLGGKEVPVQRLPVRYVFASENISVCESRSNDLGLVSCGIVQLPQAGKQSLGKEIAVQASIQTDGVIAIPGDVSDRDRRKIQEMVGALNKRIVEFLLTPFVEKKSVRVAVLIREENLSRPVPHPLVGESIASKLVEVGYQVVADRDLDKSNWDLLTSMDQAGAGAIPTKLAKLVQIAIVGNCTTRPGVKMPEFDFVPMRADGTVKAIDLSTGNIIAQKSVSDIVGFGLTSEQAGIKALQKMGEPLAKAFLEELLTVTREQGK